MDHVSRSSSSSCCGFRLDGFRITWSVRRRKLVWTQTYSVCVVSLRGDEHTDDTWAGKPDLWPPTRCAHRAVDRRERRLLTRHTLSPLWVYLARPTTAETASDHRMQISVAALQTSLQGEYNSHMSSTSAPIRTNSKHQNMWTETNTSSGRLTVCNKRCSL